MAGHSCSHEDVVTSIAVYESISFLSRMGHSWAKFEIQDFGKRCPGFGHCSRRPLWSGQPCDRERLVGKVPKPF